MPKKLKIHHTLMALVTVPICFTLGAVYLWSAYSTITERAGLFGNAYLYYHVTKLQYVTYTLSIALISLLFIFFQLSFFILRKSKKLSYLYLAVFGFIIIVVLTEVLLHSLFKGKG